MDRAESYNGNGGDLGGEITSGLIKKKYMVDCVNYIYGLGGRDFTVTNTMEIFHQLSDMVENGTEVEQYQYVGIRN